MQDQRYSDSKFDELKYVTLKGVKTSSKKSPQELATRIDEKIAITMWHDIQQLSINLPEFTQLVLWKIVSVIWMNYL